MTTRNEDGVLHDKKGICISTATGRIGTNVCKKNRERERENKHAEIILSLFNRKLKYFYL